MQEFGTWSWQLDKLFDDWTSHQVCQEATLRKSSPPDGLVQQGDVRAVPDEREGDRECTFSYGYI
jgi:hypothetical protein